MDSRVKARKEHEKAQRQLANELAEEAKVYGALIQEAYTRLGEAHMPRNDYEAVAKGQKKRKVQKVQFERVYTSPEAIFFKLLTRKKTLLGYKNALPYRVRVFDLIREETIFELQGALERVVSSRFEDPRKGAWLVVHRLEGLGGLPTMVRFNDVLEHFPDDMTRATIVLGIGEHRKVHAVDLASHPHALIAGSTGSGKSNVVNHLLSSLMMFTDPAELKFTLIDLKRLEFVHYKQSAHLFKPIVTSADDALDTLQELVEEIEHRSGLLESDGVKELAEYNELHPENRLPRLVVVIDEFAELMLASGSKVGKETDRLVSRITNIGRAAGVHLWVCTQRPATQVVSNAIKINMPLVLAGRTQNSAQSGVILGNGDAALLPLVPGRMIYQSGSIQYEIQTPYINTDNIRQAVRISKGRGQGLITMDGTEPTIVPEKLAELVATEDLPLGQTAVDERLTEFAITRPMYKRFCQEVIKTGAIGPYVTHRKGNTYYLENRPAEQNKPVLELVPLTPEQERAKQALQTLREIRAKKDKVSSA